MNQNRIKHVIDSSFSRLEVTEQSARAIMLKAREGKKVKRKVSIAFVMALVLLLLATCAIAAAVLGRLQFMAQEDYGSPLSCTVMEDTLYFTTNQGLWLWQPEKEYPTRLLPEEEQTNSILFQSVNDVFYDAQVFHTEKGLMLIEPKAKTIWRYADGVLTKEHQYTDTTLEDGGLQIKSCVYQDGALYILAQPFHVVEDSSAFYRMELASGQMTKLESADIMELCAYQPGSLLARKWNRDAQTDDIVVLDAITGKPVQTIASQPWLSICGISYLKEQDTIYAIVDGLLCRWSGSVWMEVGRAAIPNFCFFYSAIGDGYVAAAHSGIQFIPFGNTRQTGLTVRGIWTGNDADHRYQLANPGVTITLHRQPHFCAQEVREAMAQGDTTDLFHVILTARELALIAEGLAEPLSSSAFLMEDAARSLPQVQEAIFRDTTLYAYAKALAVFDWKMQADADIAPPRTFGELMTLENDWAMGAAQTNKAPGLLEEAGSTLTGWNTEEYARFLLKQYLLETAAWPEASLFEDDGFAEALLALKAAPWRKEDVVSASQVLRSNDSYKMSGTGENDPDGVYLSIPSPSVLEGAQPKVCGMLDVYLLNPNSQNKEAAIAYLEYLAANRSASDTAALQPDISLPAMYEFTDIWIAEIEADQRGYDKEEGIETDEADLARRIDEIKAMPDSWEVTAENLAYYRQHVAPYVDLHLVPLLADPYNTHDATFASMVEAIIAYMEGDVPMKDCIEQLKELY